MSGCTRVSYDRQVSSPQKRTCNQAVFNRLYACHFKTRYEAVLGTQHESVCLGHYRVLSMHLKLIRIHSVLEVLITINKTTLVYEKGSQVLHYLSNMLTRTFTHLLKKLLLQCDWQTLPTVSISLEAHVCRYIYPYLTVTNGCSR